MTDITKCSGKECPMQELCFRYLAVSEGENQTYFIKPPLKEKNGLPSCEMFWLMKETKCEIVEKANNLTELLQNEHGEGYKSGGSGHLSHVTVKLKYSKEVSWKKKLYFVFMYHVIIDSEFGGVENWIAEVANLDESGEFIRREKLRHLSEKYRDDLGM